MSSDMVDRCIQQHHVLKSYMTLFDTFLMVSKATPFHIIENRGIEAKKLSDSEAKSIQSARWLASAISGMTNVAQLSLVLSNITPLSRDPTMSEKSRGAICETVKASFKAYDWAKFQDDLE